MKSLLCKFLCLLGLLYLVQLLAIALCLSCPSETVYERGEVQLSWQRCYTYAYLPAIGVLELFMPKYVVLRLSYPDGDSSVIVETGSKGLYLNSSFKVETTHSPSDFSTIYSVYLSDRSAEKILLFRSEIRSEIF